MIVPGQALDKAETVRAMEAGPGWDTFSIDEPTLRAIEPASAALTYRFSGRRGDDFTYEALMTSVYVRAGESEWKLLLHQQTPLTDT